MNFIPYVVEKVAGGERSYDIYSRLLKERIVFLNGEVNDQVSNSICAQMLFLEAESSDQEISFYINSPGGVVTAVTVTSAGSGYTQAPTLTITPPTSGTTATATASLAALSWPNVMFLTRPSKRLWALPRPGFNLGFWCLNV